MHSRIAPNLVDHRFRWSVNCYFIHSGVVTRIPSTLGECFVSQKLPAFSPLLSDQEEPLGEEMYIIVNRSKKGKKQTKRGVTEQNRTPPQDKAKNEKKKRKKKPSCTNFELRDQYELKLQCLLCCAILW